jgi:hypothetical protein
VFRELINELLRRKINESGFLLVLAASAKFYSILKKWHGICNLNIECLADIINITRSKLNFRNNSNIT